MANNLRTYLELTANASGLQRELGGAGKSVSRFAQGARRELGELRTAGRQLSGALATIGVTFSTARMLSTSAQLDRSLTKSRQTAGATAGEMANLRRELFAMSKQTGQPLSDLQAGFDNLIASGLDWRSALESIKAVNVGSAVTSANSSVLAGGLTVGAEAFDFDLSKPGQALSMLDQMTVAGRLGNAELENLSDIFARVGVNASTAGMSFEKTLAFIETLSRVERQPERLATLADSTLRLFNNMKYSAAAAKATGVRFFDAKGNRRDAVAILSDLKKVYDRAKTEQDKARLINAAFGHTDLDTRKGLVTLFQGSALTDMERMLALIKAAGGTLNKDLGDATNNLADQGSRLKAAMSQAADSFAQPINAVLTDLIKWGMDSKQNGGLALDGKDMILGGAGLAAGTLAAGKLLPKAFGSVGRLFGQGAGVGIGVAQGKVMEELAGVTPVFVTNWPADLGGPSLPGADKVPASAKSGGVRTKVGEIAKSGQGRLAAVGKVAAGAVPHVAMGAGALAGGYAIGTGINQGLGMLSEQLTDGKYGGEGWLGSMLYDLIHGADEQEIQNQIQLTVNVDQAARATVIQNNRNTELDVTARARKPDAAFDFVEHYGF